MKEIPQFRKILIQGIARKWSLNLWDQKDSISTHTPQTREEFLDIGWEHSNYFSSALRDERQAEVGRTSSDSSSSEPKKLRLLLTFLSPTIFEYVEDAQSYDEAIKILEKTYRKQKKSCICPTLAGYQMTTSGRVLGGILTSFKRFSKGLCF